MKNGAPAAFSVDVEDYFQVEALRHLCPHSEWESFEDRTEANTDRVLALCERLGAKATFFVLGWVAERHPGLVRRIAAGGHEIASHGMNHELVYTLSPEAFREDVHRSRALLQDLSGQEVVGYRAPSYTIVERTRWALPILMEEGYRYDSSVFPIRRRRYGMPDAPRWPHTLNFKGGRLVEFPMPTLRVGFVNIPVTGGAYLRLLPFQLQKNAVSNLIDAGRPFVLNVHPWELDPDQPRFEVSRLTRWTHYHNLDRTEERLTTLLGLTTFGTQEGVLRKIGLL